MKNSRDGMRHYQVRGTIMQYQVPVSSYVAPGTTKVLIPRIVSTSLLSQQKPGSCNGIQHVPVVPCTTCWYRYQVPYVPYHVKHVPAQVPGTHTGTWYLVQVLVPRCATSWLRSQLKELVSSRGRGPSSLDRELALWSASLYHGLTFFTLFLGSPYPW